MYLFRHLALCIAAAGIASAHGVPTPAAIGPLHIQGANIVDSTGQIIPLRGTQMPGPNADVNAVEFGILRLRWNFNAVRLPVSSAMWRRDGQAYLDRVGAIVKTANDAGLVAVLANFEDGAGLPVASTGTFWNAWAAYFKNTPLVIFDIFNEPSASSVPGHVNGQRLPSDWRFWLNGGGSFVGMQTLVDAIRATGANQVIAASAFHDNLDFQGFTSDYYIRDPNIIYEVHPFFDHALTDQDRDRNFGLLTNSVPVYAGAWGLDLTQDSPACRSVPTDAQQAADLLFQILAYFDRRAISWTAASFDANSLVQNTTTFQPTQLDRPWKCGVVTSPEPGMGEVVLLWLTGDPTGFGVLAADLVASAAGGPAGPVVPGEILKLFGFLFGPPSDLISSYDAQGNLPISLGDVRLLFDGEAAPLFGIGPFQITAQVPYSLAGKSEVGVQLFYKQIPSNTITLKVVVAAPRIVTALGSNEAMALNQDGSLNSAGNPAASGSVIALFATGYGQTSPPGVTGKAAQLPYAIPLLSASVSIGGVAADLLYEAEAPGFVGLLQVNARVPAIGTGKSRSVPIVLKLGDQSSLAGVTISVL
ncbi:MAG TPA: cellulase family glycosylhydrolase [Bryobacteraceae bacterium]